MDIHIPLADSPFGHYPNDISLAYLVSTKLSGLLWQESGEMEVAQLIPCAASLVHVQICVHVYTQPRTRTLAL